jgi:rhodanese-related sulfurtransferase
MTSINPAVLEIGLLTFQQIPCKGRQNFQNIIKVPGLYIIQIRMYNRDEWFWSRNHPFTVKKENMKSLKEAVKDKDAVFVDVRSRSEFESGHVPGAKNIPLDELMGRMDELEGVGGPLVLYCRSGNRSGMALHILKEAGWDNLYNGGGLDDLGYMLN